MTDPDRSVREQVRTELERVVRRWQQLPLDHALSRSPGVRALVQELADEVADAQRRPREEVPDLGPTVLLDQLRVMVYDQGCAGCDERRLAERLTALRRAL